MSKTTSLGITKDYDDLCDTLYLSYCDIALSRADIDNDGHHIYLIKRKDTKAGDVVLSISKIEPIEYKILSSMHHILK